MPGQHDTPERQTERIAETVTALRDAIDELETAEAELAGQQRTLVEVRAAAQLRLREFLTACASGDGLDLLEALAVVPGLDVVALRSR